MKFTNCQKYMREFPHAASPAELSGVRLRLLCETLGRVQLGARYICLPADGGGHACAKLLEGAILQAEHSVGRLSAAFGFDDRESILIGGKQASLDAYCKAVTELKGAVLRCGEGFFYEEAVVAVGLLICKLEGCDTVILEGLSGKDYALDAVCAPYDLIVMPTVYAEREGQTLIRPYCEAIRRGTREVVSGNQRSEIYNCISTACVTDGIRLYLTKKAQLEVTELTLRHMSFNYGGKESYSLRSPSERLCDCALTVIESALALRRGGLKMPWSAIIGALSAPNDTGCFDLMSRDPDLILDSANSKEEVLSLLKTLDAVFSARGLDLCLCVGKETRLSDLLEAFEGREIKSLTVLAHEGETLSVKGLSCANMTFCKTAADAARASVEAVGKEGTLLCFGALIPLREVKSEIVHILGH